MLPSDWGPVILLSIGSQLFGQSLLVFAMGHLSPVVTGLGLLTQPIAAAAIGWLVYGERLGLLDFAGALADLRRPGPDPAAAARSAKRPGLALHGRHAHRFIKSNIRKGRDG